MTRASPNRSPTLSATDDDVRGVEAILHRFPELAHLRVRRRAAVVTLESGDPDRPISHARLRRQTAKLWQLEMANHMGRWQPTPFCGSRDELVEVVIGNFGWTLAERA
jgi:hypothetical protein